VALCGCMIDVQRAKGLEHFTEQDSQLCVEAAMRRMKQGHAERRSQPSPRPTETKLLIFGGTGHKTFLGCLSCNEFDSDSIFNNYGSFGGAYADTSIRNHYSEYGSPYSDNSACNRYASNPPVIVDGSGKAYGRLTLNQFEDQVKDPNVVAWLSATCTK
jgi:hypothetical protein